MFFFQYTEEELPAWYATSISTKSQPTVVSFLPQESKILVVGQDNGEIAIYNVSEGDILMSVAPQKGSVGGIRLMSISPSGDHVGNIRILKYIVCNTLVQLLLLMIEILYLFFQYL